MELELTDDQEKALKKVHQWYKLNIFTDINDAFFNLYGAAGTGKTTIVIEILKLLNGRVCVAAPTHKAKDVVSKMTGKIGLTIHSLLGLRPNMNLEHYNPNNPQYATMAEEKITDYDVIIIDECSMINRALTRELLKKAGQYKKRIIFVGDSYQLPPIGEGTSNTFKVKHTAGLKEVVRQKNGSPNQQLLLDARLDIDNNSLLIHNQFKNSIENINYTNDGKEQGFIVSKDSEIFYNKMISLYNQDEAKFNMDFIKTIAYTNEAVENLNKFIKNRINPSEELISEGDYLLGYQSVMDKNDKIVVQNSTDYYIHNLLYSESRVLSKTYKYFDVITDKITGKTIRILHPDSYKDFQETIELFYNNAVKFRAWRPYYSYLNNFVLMRDFLHSTLKNKQGKPEKIAQKNIDLGYAITTHKSQGSTYDNVAVIYSNFKKCLKVDERNRLCYVAFSRTRLLNNIYNI